MSLQAGFELRQHLIEFVQFGFLALGITYVTGAFLLQCISLYVKNGQVFFELVQFVLELLVIAVQLVHFGFCFLLFDPAVIQVFLQFFQCRAQALQKAAFLFQFFVEAFLVINDVIELVLIFLQFILQATFLVFQKAQLFILEFFIAFVSPDLGYKFIGSLLLGREVFLFIQVIELSLLEGGFQGINGGSNPATFFGLLLFLFLQGIQSIAEAYDAK